MDAYTAYRAAVIAANERIVEAQRLVKLAANRRAAADAELLEAERQLEAAYGSLMELVHRTQ
jgi:hypothetical protein